MRNLIRLTDYQKEDVYHIFKIAEEIQRGKYSDFLKGKTIILFFPDTSIRTRVTFEKGIYLLGGQSILFPTESLDKKEDLRDVCGYLNNWADMIVVRHKDINVIEKIAKYSEVPVINAMTDMNHPCEVLVDMYALSKIRKNFVKDKFLFCGKKGNIGLAWKEASEVMGFELAQCCGAGYEIDGITTYDNINEAVIGKDIIRFHTIYWPCFLMSLDIPLPKQVFGHPWVIMSDGKMSKSKGNVIYADDLVEEFGVDAVRYYFLHEIPFASDGVFTRDLLIERINGDLANILGNLVQRTISMGNKYFEGKVTNKKVSDELDVEFINKINALYDNVSAKMDKLQISDAISEIFELLRASNKYIDETTPWTLAKDEALTDRLETVLYNLLEAIRVSAVLLNPFLTKTSESIFEQINTECKDLKYNEENEYSLNKPTALFMRIDVK